MWYKQLLATDWFDPRSPERSVDFFRRTAPPMPYLAFHRHLQNHTTISKKRAEVARNLHATGRIDNRKDIIPFEIGDVVDGKAADHEQALNDTIRKFHTAVRNNKIPLTLTGGLQAIKIKADIDRSNKDRKIDLVKLFSGMDKKDA